MDVFVDPNELAAMQEERQIYEKVKGYMVKLNAFDRNGKIVGTSSGFQYSKSASYIVTCNHVRNAPGQVRLPFLAALTFASSNPNLSKHQPHQAELS